MSLPVIVALSGFGGVLTVMIFLLIMITISSKIAMAIEKKVQSK